jgi:hypothetical protein
MARPDRTRGLRAREHPRCWKSEGQRARTPRISDEDTPTGARKNQPQKRLLVVVRQHGSLFVRSEAHRCDR